MKILVARPDRLGDVILSTPVFQAIQNDFPEASVHALVRENVKPLLASLSNVHVFDPDGVHSGWSGFSRLCREIRQNQYDLAIVLQSHWKIAAALFLAGVPKRIGPYSKWYSYFLFNKGIRQRRSKVEMHETDYNLELLRPLGIGARKVGTHVTISAQSREKARIWLLKQGFNLDADFVAIHPGMGGSALNWPEESYLDLIKKLSDDQFQILITTGASEAELSRRLETALHGRKVHCYRAGVSDGVEFLGALYSWANLVVAPSTGPLHLAVALGKPVVSFYPPILVQSPKRWGPYTKDATVFVPKVDCGQRFQCLGQACPHFFCMGQIEVEKVFSEIKRRIHGVSTQDAFTF